MKLCWQENIGVLLLLIFSVASANGKNIDKIAILTPQSGTDYGWNQQGIKAAREAGLKEGVKVLVAENLGYGDIRPTLNSLIDDGAQLLIAHASGYNQSAPEISARRNVPVAITDNPGARQTGLVADYTVNGQEGAFLAGVLAAKMTRSGVLGIVVSGEPPSWNAQSNAFIRGARKVKPDITIHYAVIGPAAYSDVAGGKRVTSSMIATGADIIFGQGDEASFGMLQAVDTIKALDGGKVYFIDVIGDKFALDRQHLLSSVMWNLTPVFTRMIEDLKGDKYGQHNYQTSLADGSISLLKTENIPEEVWASVDAVRQQIIQGTIKVPAVYDAKALHELLAAADG